MPTDDILPLSTENPLCRRIENHDLASIVNRQNSIVRRFENLAFHLGDLTEIAAGFPTDQLGPHEADQLVRLVDKGHYIIVDRKIDPVMPRCQSLGFQLCQVIRYVAFGPQLFRREQQGPHADHSSIGPGFILYRQRKIWNPTENGDGVVHRMATEQYRFPDQIVFAKKHACTSWRAFLAHVKSTLFRDELLF